MTSAKTGSIGGPQPSVVSNADILMYDERLFCGTEKSSIAAIVPIEQGHAASSHSWDWACVTGIRPFRVGSRSKTGTFTVA
jgi:hypothetical protein